jgi:hypothetical protein
MAHACGGGVSTPALWQFGCRKDALPGWQRRGGGIALRSTKESIVTIVSNSPAAALVATLRECVNITTIKVVSASTLARFYLGIFGSEQNDWWGGEKSAKQSHRGEGSVRWRKAQNKVTVEKDR